MGAAQSSQGLVADTDYAKKIALFSNIFSKMLQQSDIIDIRALTSGPGACGSYVLLLQKNMEKEFKTMKLASKNDVKDFVFAKRNSIESISDSEACTNLAIFYLRALQLVAAIMLSVYSPPDLLTLLRNKIRQEGTVAQKIIAPLAPTPQQIAQKELMRERWFAQNFLKDTQIPNLFVIDGDEQLNYDSTHDTLIFNDYSTSKQHKALLKVEELEQYNINESDKRGRKYWISLYNPINGNRIVRRLISDKDSTALIYNAETTEKLTTNIPLSDTKPYDWTSGLSKEMVKMPFIQIPIQALTTMNPRATRKNRYNKTTNSTNVTKNLNTTRRSTLSPEFQNSYDLISKWFSQKESILEVNPGAYRSILLFNQHIAVGETDSTNMATDFWQNTPLRQMLTFSTLESLFNDKDTGTMSLENETALATVANRFNEIYEPFLSTPVTNAKNFSDVVFPDFKNMRSNPTFQNNMKERLYDLSDADGRTKDPCPLNFKPNANCWPKGFNQLIMIKQQEIQDLQNQHLENCIILLKDIFAIDPQKNTVYFTDKFLSDVRGVRAILEDYMVYTRKLIADYYIDVETKYYEVVKKIAE